jgi:integrase
VQHSKGGFRIKADAKAYLDSIVGNVRDGSWSPDKPITVEQLLLEHWLPAQESVGLRPTTIAQYQMVARSWIVPHIGGIKVASLTPAMVNGMTTALKKSGPNGRRGLSDRSTQMAVGLLKAACQWAVRDDNRLIGRNPIGSMRRPRAMRTEMKVWDAAETKQFLAATANDRVAFAWALALTRGLRRGEICGLRWSDVHFEDGYLLVVRTRIQVRGQAKESAPKTSAGKRSIPLDPKLITILRTHKARQAEEKLAAGSLYEDSGFLFADELGRAYHPDTLSDWFDAKVSASGLPRIRFHDTRHTAATLLVAGGTPIKVVSDLLGHASINITLEYYSHVLPGMAEEAGAELSRTVLA